MQQRRTAEDLVVLEDERVIHIDIQPIAPGDTAGRNVCVRALFERASDADALCAHGYLDRVGREGLYVHSPLFEGLLQRIDLLIAEWCAGKLIERVRLTAAPPASLGASAADASLLAGVPSYRQAIDAVVASAPLPEAGLLVDASCAAMQPQQAETDRHPLTLRQRTFVRVGTMAQVAEFLEDGIEYAQSMMRALHLPAMLHVPAIISGPAMPEQGRRFELYVPGGAAAPDSLVGSFEAHRVMPVDGADVLTYCGEAVHTGASCFVPERIALSLFQRYGFDIECWPYGVRGALWGRPECDARGASTDF